MKKCLVLFLFVVSFFMFMPKKAYATDVSDWAKLQDVMNLKSTEGVAGVFEVVPEGDFTRKIKLLKDITATSADNYLVVSNVATIYLDMNGHKLDRGLAKKDAVANGYLIRVNGYLEIYGGGTLCGGNNADTVDGGGAIYNLGILSIDGTTICDNKAICGGAIYNNGLNESSKVTVTNSTIRDNEATGTSEVGGKGGAIYNAGKGTLTVTESTISGNYATGLDKEYSEVCGEGGAIFNAGKKKVTVTGSTISDNHVTGYCGHGGAIFNDGTLVIEGNTTICNNRASEKGGAIHNTGELTVKKSTMQNNTSTYDGGAIYNYYRITLENSTISNNSSRYGGAVYNEGDLTATASIFDNNVSTKAGGAIFNQMYHNVNLVTCNLTNNKAVESSGGAIYTDGTVYFTGFGPSSGIGIIDNCNADVVGGAVDITNHGRFEMSNGKISNCSAPKGGAIYVHNGKEELKGTAQLTNSIIEACEASNVGGGIYSEGVIGLESMTISGNEAVNNGGGIYLEKDGSIFLGTSTKITENKVNECANNLYLADNLQMVKFGSGEDVKAPSSGMLIGVTKKTGPVVKNPVEIIVGAKDTYKNYVVSDNDAYVVKVNDDKLMLAMNHTHDYEFSIEDKRIVAKCKGPCEDFYDDNPFVLTLISPSVLEYDGKEKVYSFADAEVQVWSEAGFDVPTITYYKKSASGASFDKINSAPVDVGIYQARVDIASKSATYDFEIKKKPEPTPTPEPDPTPTPTPEPDPTPTPTPDPEPAPSPEPDLKTQPTSKPTVQVTSNNQNAETEITNKNYVESDSTESSELIPNITDEEEVGVVEEEKVETTEINENEPTKEPENNSTSTESVIIEEEKTPMAGWKIAVLSFGGVAVVGTAAYFLYIAGKKKMSKKNNNV